MEKKNNLISRRQAIASMAAVAAGTLIKPPTILASANPVKSKSRFAVIGDWGTGDNDQLAIANRMIEAHRKEAFDFVIAAGDNIYPNGAGRYFTKKFEEPFSALINDKVNFYAVLGNHDVEQGRQDQIEYPLFNMNNSNYYTIRKGNGVADFFMIDSTSMGRTQMTWLENSLRQSNAKWKIAVFHHPIYSSGKKHGSNEGLRKMLEPVLVQYGVNVVFSGHDHFYERTKPQQGIQYFVTGAGGQTRRGGIDLESEFRAVSFDEDNHYMLIELDENEISFKAIAEKGDLIDSGVIKKG